MKRARVAYAGAVHHAVADEAAQMLRLADGREVPFDAVVWLPPVSPRTVFALALNYADHAQELAFKAPDKPLVFLKGANSFVGHGGQSVCPDGVEQMHFECELAVVIGRGGRRIACAHAYDHVAGYTVVNDYALREYLEDYYRPNLKVKNRDLCTPMGPWLVDAEDVGVPDSLGICTTVNGEVVQQGNTRDMIFDVPALIEYLSGFMTLSPGDMILTGTPKGVRYLRPGDEVVTSIDKVGSLVNTIIRPPAAAGDARRPEAAGAGAR